MGEVHTDSPERVLHVRSEDEAFGLLERALAGRIPQAAIVDFVGWPTVEILLPNTPLNASISPTMMAAFIELQTAIYRAHSLISFNSGDLRRLSEEEKGRIEFRVKVKDGSSEYITELAKPLTSIATEVVNKMTATDLVISVIAIAIIAGSTIAYKAWLAHRTEVRKAEIGSDDKKSWLEMQKEHFAHDTKRFELLVKAIQQKPILGDIEEAMEPARNELTEAVAEERGGRAFGVDLSPEFAFEVVSQKRQYGKRVEPAGIYRVARVDTTVPDGFRVTLTDIETGEEVTASLQDALISEDHRRLIQDAEWNKRPIRVQMRARLLRNRFVDAVILATEPVEAQQISN